MSDLPSQYAEKVETFRQMFELPDPRETLPRFSITVLGLDNEKVQQELRSSGFWFLASYRSDFQNWGSVSGTQTGFFSNIHFIY